MSDELNFTISIPTDNDGYVLLKCPTYGTFFKVTPSDIQDDGILRFIVQAVGLHMTTILQTMCLNWLWQ